MAKIIGKTGLILAGLILSLIPFWIWLGIYELLDPDGFWQKLVVYGLGFYFFATIQLISLGVWVCLSGVIIMSK